MIDFLDQSQMWAPGNYSGLSLIKRSTRETYQEITDFTFHFSNRGNPIFVLSEETKNSLTNQKLH